MNKGTNNICKYLLLFSLCNAVSVGKAKIEEKQNEKSVESENYLQPVQNGSKRWIDKVQAKKNMKEVSTLGFVLPPPFGQMYNKDKNGALIWGGLFLSSVCVTCFFHIQYIKHFRKKQTDIANNYYRYRNIGIACTCVSWALGVLQSYIYAGLNKTFDVSNDMSVEIMPVVTSQSVGVGVDVSLDK